MHSPLPDSSALESGIIEDPRPTRLSRVQDNVRNLLRNSTLVGSIRSSLPETPTRLPGCNYGLGAAPPTPPETPTRTPLRPHQPRSEPEVLPSPTESLPSTASPTSSTSSASSAASLHPQEEESPSGLFPPPAYLSPLVARMSKLLARAPALAEAVDHPDVNEIDVEALARQKAEKRQRRAWKRKRVVEGGRRGKGGASGGTQCLLCVIAALMLASIVATYLIVATTSSNITTTFHVLFILGIILATIVFAHTLIRLLLISGSFRRGQQVLILPAHRRRHHNHRRHHARRGDSVAVQQVRAMPSLSSDAMEFAPATPIRVQMGAEEDEVRPESRDAVPTAVDTEVEPVDVWDKARSPIANPPPAYGRWRGSVRANPDLLHWQAIPSPIDDDARELPSPTYEEAMLAQRTGPPSYVTRESPARTAGREDVRGSVLQRADAQEQVAEPEMIEVVGHASDSVGVAK